MNAEQAHYLEQRHNVTIDAETEQYNISDEEYGWQAIPVAWVEEMEQNINNK